MKQNILVLLMRLALGWLFFYAGLTKILDPQWSAGGYLKSAKTLAGFYQWLANPALLPLVNFINEWGLTLLGAALILGLSIKWASYILAGFMLLYYLPALNFPIVGEHSFLVDEHIIYILALLLLAKLSNKSDWSITKLWAKKK